MHTLSSLARTHQQQLVEEADRYRMAAALRRRRRRPRSDEQDGALGGSAPAWTS